MTFEVPIPCILDKMIKSIFQKMEVSKTKLKEFYILGFKF